VIYNRDQKRLAKWACAAAKMESDAQTLNFGDDPAPCQVAAQSIQLFGHSSPV